MSNFAVEPLFEPPKMRFGAHRGARTRAPENSIPAYIKAGQMGFDWAWIAVIRQSADGTWYVLHDDTVDRTTDGTGHFSDLTDAQIADIHLDEGANLEQFSADELRIPKLEEVIRICRKYGMGICFRLCALPLQYDTPADRASWDSFLALVHKYRLEASLFSGDTGHIEVLKQLTDNWHGQRMCETGESVENTFKLVDEFLEHGWTNMSVLASYEATTPETVAYAHAHGFRYVCHHYPDPTPEILQNMCDWGVDICQNGVFAHMPD